MKLQPCLDKNTILTKDQKDQVRKDTKAFIDKGLDPAESARAAAGAYLVPLKNERQQVENSIRAYYDDLVKRARAAGRPVYEPPKPDREPGPPTQPGLPGMMNPVLRDIMTMKIVPTRDDLLTKLSNKEFKALNTAMGFPESGNRSEKVDRFLGLMEVRFLLQSYANTFEGAKSLAGSTDKKRLKALASTAKVWKSGSKQQLAGALLSWRDRTRHKGLTEIIKSFKAAGMDASMYEQALRTPLGTIGAEKPPTAGAPQPLSKYAIQSKVLADWVAGQLENNNQVTWRELFKQANKAYGGTQAEGVYTPKDAYDAMELGVNLHLLRSIEFIEPDGARKAPEKIIDELKQIGDLLPTQTKRTQEQEDFQQFSTPPFLAYAANHVANIQAGDVYLEPSGGIGGLAIFGKMSNAAEVIVNELSKRRIDLLKVIQFSQYFNEDAIQLNNILPETVKPTVIVMNPPFSATGGRLKKNMTKYGAQHIEQALKRLAPGGRLVAIVGKGMSPTAPTFKKWWRDISKQYDVKANIGISGEEYRKYGTTFDNRLLVIDKVEPKQYKPVVAEIEKVDELPGLLEDVRNDRPQIQKPDEAGEQPPLQPPLPEDAETGPGEPPTGDTSLPEPSDLGDREGEAPPEGGTERPPGDTGGGQPPTDDDVLGDQRPPEGTEPPGPGKRPPGTTEQRPGGDTGGVPPDTTGELSLDDLENLIDEVSAEEGIGQPPKPKPPTEPAPPPDSTEWTLDSSDKWGEVTKELWTRGNQAQYRLLVTPYDKEYRDYLIKHFTDAAQDFKFRGPASMEGETYLVFDYAPQAPAPPGPQPPGPTDITDGIDESDFDDIADIMGDIEIKEAQAPYGNLQHPEAYQKAKPIFEKTYQKFVAGLAAQGRKPDAKNTKEWVRIVLVGLNKRNVNPDIAKNWILYFYQNDRPAPAAPTKKEQKKAIVEKAKKKFAEIKDKLYERYTATAKIKGAKAHPTLLDESAALADTTPPVPTYRPTLPQDMIDSGKTSDAQLENVVYAGQSHDQVLPNGERKGFFVGAGTGVGKGRIIASIMLDNWNKGRRKAVWVSETSKLVDDARRDLGYDRERKKESGIGWKDGVDSLFTLGGKHKLGVAGKNFPQKEGILFTTYATLRSNYTRINENEAETLQNMRVRINQIVDWLGKDFDGVIAFDESHNMANATAQRGERGTKAAANQALAGIMLQNRLPNARVVYVSATGATEVSNFAYAERLGLWGEGTAFPRKQTFIDEISGSGLAAMEMIARDMKSQGLYLAPALSYDGVTYDRITHPLDDRQKAKYDELAGAWQIVLQNIHVALAETNQDGAGHKKAAIWSQFWGGHQRFFNQVITTMQMGSAITHIEDQIKKGNSIVLQLVNHGGAQIDRVTAAKTDEQELEDLDFTPRESLMSYIQNSFPVHQYEHYQDEDGNDRVRPVHDSEGNPVLNQEAVAMREELLNRIGAISIANSPLDLILDHFGTDNVAEVTGRKRRIVRDPDTGKTIQEKWSDAKANNDAEAFMNDEKRILVFSQKGGTGRSYHADLDTNNHRKRIHYLIQPGWRADKAIQGLGRTHRSNQAQPPEYFLVTTDLNAQKRFISSIARRLDQLGALTKGQRQTGSQGIFQARDNLESEYARVGLYRLFEDIVNGDAPITADEFFDQTALQLVNEDGGLTNNLPTTQKFMNRLLSMTIKDQNLVFNEWSDRIDAVIDAAAQAGTLDVGIETITGLSIDKTEDMVVNTDPNTGAETRYVKVELEVPSRRKPWESVVADKFYVNKKSGKLWAASGIRTRTDASGNVYEYRTLTSAAGSNQVIRMADLFTEDEEARKFEELKSEVEAQALWEDQYQDAPATVKRDVHLITGALLPIWDRLKGSATVNRLQTDDGERFLGRVINANKIDEVLENLGVSADPLDVSGDEVARRILEEDARVRLSNGWRMKRVTLSGEERIELLGPNFDHWDQMTKYGVIMEKINYKTRYFIPTGAKAGSTMDAITKYKPIANIEMPYAGPQLSDQILNEPQDLLEKFGKGKQVQLSLFGGNQANLFTDTPSAAAQGEAKKAQMKKKLAAAAKKAAAAEAAKIKKQRAPRQVVTLQKTGDISHYGTKVRNWQEAGALMSFLANKAAEEAYSVSVDKDGTVLQIHKISKGSSGSASVPIIEAGGTFLREDDATKVYFVHQHPSGRSNPSPEDMNVVRSLRAIGSLKGQRVTGVIITTDQVSMFDPDGIEKTVAVDMDDMLKLRVASNLNTKAAEAKTRLPIKERFVKPVRGWHLAGLPELRDSKTALEHIDKTYGGLEGFLVLDAQNRDLAFLPWKGGRATKETTRELIEAIEGVNGAAIVINWKDTGSSQVGKLNETRMTFLQNLMESIRLDFGNLTLHDVMVDRRSWRDSGLLTSLEKQIATLNQPANLKGLITEDILFNRKVAPPVNPLTVQQVQQTINPFTQEMKTRPAVTVLGKQESLPAGVRRYLRSVGGENDVVVGAFHEGRVYFVAENIGSEQEALRTLFHEVFGHFGIRGVLGTDLDKMLQSVYIAKRAQVEAIATEYGYDLRTKEGRAAAAEEWLAREAEVNPNSSWIDRLVALIRKWMRKVNRRLALSDAEIRALIGQARKYVATNQKATVFPPMRFDRLPETADRWYSQMEQHLASTLDNRGTVPTYKAMLQKMVKGGKIKAEELEWSGLLDYLDTRTGKVSKADIMRYLTDNNVKLEEILRESVPGVAEISQIQWQHAGNGLSGEFYNPHTGEELDIGIIPAYQTEDGQMWDMEIEGDSYGSFESVEDAQQYAQDEIDQMMSTWDDMGDADEALASSGQAPVVRYGREKLNIPGGEQYKELLLIMPQPPTQLPTGWEDLSQEYGTWLEKNKLPAMSADELIMEEGVTKPQQAWLNEFMQRWEKMERTEGEGADPELIRLVVEQENKYTGQRTVQVYYDGNWAATKAGTRLTDAEIKQDYVDSQNEARRLKNRAFGPGQPFRHDHWQGIDNVLVHVRFDERLMPNGEKVLFLQEVQSDWHALGKDEGYQRRLGLEFKVIEMADADAATKERYNFIAGDAGWIAIDPMTGAVYGVSKLSAVDALQAAKRQFDRPTDARGVPDAPFKKTHRLLMMKRMVRWAAENDFDRIAWTTGQMQADRYDVSRQVDRIEVVGRTDATTMKPSGKGVEIHTIEQGIIGLGVDENGIIDNIDRKAPDTWKGKPLSHVIGKDMSKKIVEMDPGTISGEGLKVGGEGLKEIYDVMLPNELNKFFDKESWGRAHVEPIPLPHAVAESEKTWAVVNATGRDRFYLADSKKDAENWIKHNEKIYPGIKVAPNEKWYVLDVYGTPEGYEDNGKPTEFATQEAAQAFLLDQYNGNGSIRESKMVDDTPVLSLPVTPQMKSKALYKGMPLFSRKRHGDYDIMSKLPEEVRDRMARARGVPKDPWTKRAKESIAYLKSLRHHFPAMTRLENVTEAAQLSDILRQHQEIPETAKDRAVRAITRFTKPLNQSEYEVFRTHIILSDMMRDVDEGLISDEKLKEGETLPFGFENVSQLQTTFEVFDRLADETPVIRKSLDDRKSMINKMVREMVKFKILKKEVMKHKDYFHHQVLSFWAGNKMKTAGTSSADVRTHWRPWMAARKGSLLDYNTEYVEAEFSALAQQMAQLETAKTLDKIKRKSDVYRDLKTQAKYQNLNQFYVEAAESLSKMFGQEITPHEARTNHEIDPLFSYRQNIAMASSNLRRMAFKGKIDGVDSEWDDVLDALAEEYQLSKMGLDEDALGLSERPTISDGRYFAFLSYLINAKKPGAMWAATTFKAIKGREAHIKGALGDRFVTYKKLIPENYVEWKPDPKKGWFWANSIADNIVQKIIEGEKALEDRDVRKVLAKGQELIWVIPEGLAETLDNFRKYPDPNSLGKIADWGLRAWKQWVLLNPRRAIKYNVNNMSGDLDIAIAYAPGIATPKAMVKALRDLQKWHKRKELPAGVQAEMDNARAKGVIGSGFAVQEVDDVLHLMSMDKWVREVLLGEKPNIAMRYWEKVKGATVIRENMLRLAAYRWFRHQLSQGKAVYGASKRVEIDAIKDKDDRAAKLARELIGDYGNISAAGQYIRQRLIPFYSWMEINLPRYVYLMRNLRSEDRHSDAAATRRRMAGIVSKRVLTGSVKLAIKANLLMGAVLLYNMLAHRDEWEELGEAKRRQQHLILGRNEAGEIQTLRFQGALSDALSWFGLEDWPADLMDIKKGKASLQDKMVEVPKAITTKAIHGIRPEPKLLFETLTQESTYPDPFSPRPIRDTTEHILRTFSLDSIYRMAAGKPGRGKTKAQHFLNDIKNLLVYSSDPGEQAYYDARKMVFDYLDAQGIERPSGKPTNRSNALYYYRQALKYGDIQAAKRYLDKYYDMGGSPRSLRTSIKRAHPLGSLPMKNRFKFRQSLTPEEQERLKFALEWYDVYRSKDLDVRIERAQEKYGKLNN